MRRPLYGWLTADAISLTGTRLSMLALPWFVLVTTGSATRTGLVALVELAPLVALKIVGGPIIDRVGARRISIGCDLGSTVVVGAIPMLYAAGLLSLPLLLGLVALGGALRGPGDAAKAALTPVLVEVAGVPLERATGLSSMVERSATMLGAAVAGVLIGTIGAPAAIGVDAVSFAVCAGVLAWATAGLPRPEPEPAGEPYGRQLRAGWDFLRHDRILVAIALMVALTNLIDLAWSSVLMPVWGRAHAGAAEIGAVFAVWSGASALGSAVAARWAGRLPRYATYLVAFLITGLPRFVVFALGVPLVGVLAVCVVGGFASGFLNPVLGAVEIERIPRHLLGRVGSLMTAACYALMPLGGLLGGGLVSALGLSAALLVCGAAYFVVTMLPAVDPAWRELDRRVPTTEPVAPAA